MKTVNRYTLMAICAMALTTSSCDFEEVNTNQFEMTEEEGTRDDFAVGGLITALEKTVFPVGTQADDTDVINQYQIAFHLSADSWSGYFGQNNSWDSGNNNTSYFLKDGWIAETYKCTYTNALNAWKKLKKASEDNNTPEVFALAQVLKISAWHKALESFGPIPYSHAADATMNIPFDSEKDVYTAMFKDLTEAIDVLTAKAENGVSIMKNYDAVYAGDAAKWVRYANSLMLRLAMHIRYADNEMAKKYAAQAITQAYGVMTDQKDEAKMSTGAGLVFRNNIQWLSDQYEESRMGTSMVAYLLGYEDPRLSAYFQPVDESSSYGIKAFDGKKYQGVPLGHKYGQTDMYKKFSKPNIQASTPTYWLRASEVYFLRAEAALVWGGEFGDAESLYEQGIQMSFDENGVKSSVDSYMYSGKTPIANALSGWYYTYSYPAPCETTVEFEGSQEDKLEKIMIQKWIALYPNGQEAWTEWRRTGYPVLNKVLVNRGSSQGATADGGVRRMLYPISFYQTQDGKEIYDNALKLFNNGKGGQDRSDTRLWWDCK